MHTRVAARSTLHSGGGAAGLEGSFSALDGAKDARALSMANAIVPSINPFNAARHMSSNEGWWKYAESVRHSYAIIGKQMIVRSPRP